jgi:cell division protein FtsB
MGFNVLRMTKEQRYRVLLFVASFAFLAVSGTSGLIVYQSYRQCKAMEARALGQWECYLQIKDQFEILQEHLRELIENPDFLEHVTREHLQIAGENEILFRFE